MIPASLAASYRAWGAWTSETLPQVFERVCGAHSRSVALIDGPLSSLSFSEVATRVSACAAGLVSLGVQPGDVVSWQLPGWWEALVVHQAALRIGAIPNPLNTIFRAREMSLILSEAAPKVLFVPKTFRGFNHAALAVRLGLAEHIVSVRGKAEGCISFESLPSGSVPVVQIEPSTPALLLYTSGTTSDPKGVIHSHESLLYEIRSLSSVHALTQDDRYLAGSPLTHVAGLVYGVLMPFVLGTSTALMERWDPVSALRLIEWHGVTFQTGAPAFLLTMASALESHDTSSFRLFSTGGASIATPAVREAASVLGCVVKRAYGSTEFPTLTATRFEDPPNKRIGTDGRVIAPAEMRIVRPSGDDAPPGEEGEIWARGPDQFAGYWNALLNTESFGEDGWYRTGDLGMTDHEGYLRVTGRTKDIIIRGGENISAKEIEDLLSAHPSVAEVAVVGVPDDVLGERACAVVVLRSGSALTFEDMTSFLQSHEIAKQKLPEQLVVRTRLPRTTTGKVIKTTLRQELS